MTSSFDPTQFLDSTTTEAASRRPPLPVGDYLGVLGAPDVRQVQGKKDPSQSYTFIDFPVSIDLSSSPKARDLVGQDMVKLRYSVSLDINDHGSIDWSPGRNTGLRFLREATNTNVAGQAFSIRGLEGRMVKCKVTHREYPEGSGEMQDNITAVAKP
jgi:hypothetical protein